MSEPGVPIGGAVMRPCSVPPVCVCQVRRMWKRADGSHWCGFCGGYCGTAGVDGHVVDHPEPCSCPPRPEATSLA